MKSWLCFYEKPNYNEAKTLFDCLSKASKTYGFNIIEPEWVEMCYKSRSKDWIETAESYKSERFFLASFSYLLSNYLMIVPPRLPMAEACVMMTCLTPASTALRAFSILGRMPPLMMPVALYCS